MHVNLVSLVIPLYNQLDYTRGCIASIEACTKMPYELILVNNGSQDGTNNFLSAVSHAVISNETNLGCARAWNQGVRASKGEVIGILNNDIVVTPGWLEGLLTFMHQSGYGIVCPSAREGPLDYDLDRYARDFTFRCSAATRRELYGACFLVRREIFERIGLFDEGFTYGGCEDIDFQWRAMASGFGVAITGSVLIHHYGMVTQDAIKTSGTRAYPKANLAHFKAKWGRTVRGNWFNRRWDNFKSSWQRRFERFRYGHMLIEKPKWSRHPTMRNMRDTP